MTQSDTALRILSPRGTLLGSTGDALENLIVDELPSGAICIVPSEGLYILYKDSNAAVAPPNVIATGRGSSSPGRWIIFEGGVTTTAPLRNTLYVDPTSTATPETGSILAPYTELQDALDAIPDSNYWLIIIPPGIEISENITVPPTVFVEIQCEAPDQLGILTGNITWNPDGSLLGIANIYLTGNITGTATVSGGGLVLDTTTVNGNVAVAADPAGDEVRAYLNGRNNFDHVSAAGDFPEITGTFTCGGRVYGTGIMFRGNISVQFLTLEACWLGGSSPITVTASENSIRLVDTTINLVSAFVFSGAAGSVSMDGYTTGFFLTAKPAITNGAAVLYESDLEFGGTLPNADADVDPALGSLFWVFDISANRDYTAIAAGAVVNQAVSVECRNANGFTPALRNGGGTPSLLVNMTNGFGYVIIWDGTDWSYVQCYRLPS